MSARSVTSTQLPKFERTLASGTYRLCICDRALQASVTVITDKDMCVRGRCSRDEKTASQV